MAERDPAPDIRALLERRRGEIRYRGEQYRPGPALAPLVERFWTVRWDLERPERVRTLSDPTATLVIERGRSVLLGVVRGRFERHLVGTGSIVAAKLHPGAIPALTGQPAHAFTDRRVPLAGLLDIAGWEDALLDDAPEPARIQRFEALLGPRMASRTPEAAWVQRAVEAARADPSLVRVDALATATGRSVRTLQRAFRRQVGASPKWVVQRFRLQEAVRRLVDPVDDHAALALRLGYADQAHFIRDFSATVGHTPGAYAKRFGPA